jgi:hypothetical protein
VLFLYANIDTLFIRSVIAIERYDSLIGTPGTVMERVEKWLGIPRGAG